MENKKSNYKIAFILLAAAGIFAFVYFNQNYLAEKQYEFSKNYPLLFDLTLLSGGIFLITIGIRGIIKRDFPFALCIFRLVMGVLLTMYMLFEIFE